MATAQSLQNKVIHLLSYNVFEASKHQKVLLYHDVCVPLHNNNDKYLVHLFCIPEKKWSHVVLQTGPEENYLKGLYMLASVWVFNYNWF